MKATLGIIVMALTSVACVNLYDHPSNVYTVMIDPTLGPARIVETMEALDLWAADVHAKGMPLTFQVIIGYRVCDHECTDMITIHPDTVAHIQTDYGQEGAHADGVCNREWAYNNVEGSNEWSNIYVGSDIKDDAVWQHVMRHEIGHALALQHTGPKTVMSGRNNMAAPKPVCEDIQQYGFRRGITISCP